MGQKSRGPLKMSREMAHKVIVPQKKLGPKVSETAGQWYFYVPECRAPPPLPTIVKVYNTWMLAGGWGVL